MSSAAFGQPGRPSRAPISTQPGGTLRGASVSAFNNIEGTQHGLTIGLLNIAGELNGVQLGVINIARNNPRGLQVLPLYVSRQSYVRAKVTSFLLDDPSIPASEKADISQNAAQYYRLAWQMTQAQQGQIILMAGLSGSGKTTAARQLAPQVKGIHIRSDAVRKHLGGIPLEQRGDDQLYTAEMTQKTYGRLLELGVTLASQGYTVILDAKYDRADRRQAAIAAAAEQDLPLHILYCDAPLEVLQQRLEQRRGDIADATVDILEKQRFEPFAAAAQEQVITLDTTQDLQPQLQPFVSAAIPST